MCYECTTLFGEEECGEDFEPEDIEKVDCDGTDICMIHVAPEICKYCEGYHQVLNFLLINLFFVISKFPRDYS